MALKDFRRDESSRDGILVDLENGVSAILKEYGTPEYWMHFLSKLDQDLDISEVTTEQDEQATLETLVEHCVVEIIDGETHISDKEELMAILSDETYWPLKRVILMQSRNAENFKPKDSPEISSKIKVKTKKP